MSGKEVIYSLRPTFPFLQIAQPLKPFLVACYATLHPALCVRRLVGWSVGRSVGPHFTFFIHFSFLTSPLLLEWSSDLKYSPCPPARPLPVEYIMTNVRGEPVKRARSCFKFQIYKIQLNICVSHFSCHTMFFRSVKCTK